MGHTIKLAALAIVLWSAATASAQVPLPPPPARLPAGGDFFLDGPPPRMEDFSLIYTPAEEPRIIKVHDILTIIVDEKAEVTSNSRFNRSRRTMFSTPMIASSTTSPRAMTRPARTIVSNVPPW